VYVIVRSTNAGVFAGELESRNGDEVVMTDARRIWFWDGAASLSELAIHGTSKPGNCKFPVSVPRETILGVIEVIEASDKARESIEAVPVWSKHG
jgi:hypothetical protein